MRTVESFQEILTRRQHSKTWNKVENGIKRVRHHMQGNVNSPRDLGEGQNEDYGNRNGKAMKLRNIQKLRLSRYGR